MTIEEFLNLRECLYEAYIDGELTKEELAEELNLLDNETIENSQYYE